MTGGGRGRSGRGCTGIQEDYDNGMKIMRAKSRKRKEEYRRIDVLAPVADVVLFTRL